VADPPGPDKPASQCLPRRATLLESEARAPRLVDPLRGRFWKVVNPSRPQSPGRAGGLQADAGDNVLPFAGPEASVTKRRPS